MTDRPHDPPAGTRAGGAHTRLERPHPERAPIRVRVASSVRFRLTVTVVLVVGLSLLGGGALLVRWVEATLVNDLRTRNEQVLTTLAESLQLGRVPAELQYSLVDPDAEGSGTTRGLFGQSGSGELSGTEYFLDRDGVTGLKVKGENAQGLLLVRHQAALPTGVDAVEAERDVATRWGVFTLHAVSSMSEIDRSVRTLSAALWLGLPVLSIGAGIMTWLITGRALAPVGVMTRRVRELSATTLDARVPVPPTDDEISQLAQTMNDMLDRLHKASLAQRQFVSDASHELRSPVASIRAQLETALRYPTDVDWPSVAKIVLEEDSRLEHLVGNLLAMARLEEGRLGPRSDVDLDDLVLSQTPRMTGVHLDLSGVSAGRVWGNRDELTSVVRNLLDNAARHARAEVKVSVREEGPWVVLAVADDGPGVDAEHRERVFERFTRLQEGRSRDQGGTGLGLALSRRIVEHHGGRIHVEDAEGGGARFVVSLPAAAWTGTLDEAAGTAQSAPQTQDPPEDQDDPEAQAAAGTSPDREPGSGTQELDARQGG